VSGSPLPGTDEARAELQASGPPPEVAPFWRTRAWWHRAGHTAIAVYVSTALAFLGTLAVARGLGPHELGTVVLAVAIATLFGTLLDLSLEEAVVHHGYRALAGRDTPAVRGLIRASLILDLAIGVVVALSVVVLAAPLADIGSAGRLDPNLVRLAALVILAGTLDSTMSAILQVAGRPDLRGWVMTITNLARLIGVLIAVHIGSAAAVIVAYAAGNAVGAVVHGLIARSLVRRRWPLGDEPPVLRVPVKELVRFGSLTSLTTSVAAANGALIPVILGRAAGPAEVGLFRVGSFPVFLSDNVSAPLRLVLYPEQARLSAKGDVAQIRRAIRSHTLAGFAVSLPFAIAAWFLLPWLLPLLYSDQFEGAVTTARILLIAAVVRFAASWFKTLPAALGKPQLRAALALLELGLMVSLLIILGDQGSEGAAIAFSAASIGWVTAAILSVRVVLARAEAGQTQPAPAESSKAAP
jgi:O-antigen/teichoic acid export membrane protein